MEIFTSQKWEQTSPISQNQEKLVKQLEKMNDLSFPWRIISQTETNINSTEKKTDLKKQKQKITNLKSFFSWNLDFSEEQEEVNDQDVNIHYDELNKQEAILDSILDDINIGMEKLVQLEKDHKIASTKTEKLHQLCQNLLHDQNLLTTFSKSIDDKLKYFNSYQPLLARFQSGNLNIFSKDFVSLIEDLDDSIQFFQANDTFLESNIYLIKFKQLQTRAFTMIKHQFIEKIRITTEKITQSLNEFSQLGETSIMKSSEISLFYANYKTFASSFKELFIQFDKRSNNIESSNIYNDCKNFFTNSRLNLLFDPINKHFKKIKVSLDLVDFTRFVSEEIILISRREYELYHQFFPNFSHLEFSKQIINENQQNSNDPNDNNKNDSENKKNNQSENQDQNQQKTHNQEQTDYQIDELVKNIGNIGYDLLRTDVLQTREIIKLSNLINLIRQEIKPQIFQKEKYLQILWGIFDSLVEDAQERLVFQAQLLIYNKIAGFSFNAEQIMNFIETQIEKKSSTNTEPTKDSNENLTKQEIQSWYPSVRWSLSVLARTHKLVDQTIFQALSQETLLLCEHSLVQASKTILHYKKFPNPLEANFFSLLFLLRNLHILVREMSRFGDIYFDKQSIADYSSFGTKIQQNNPANHSLSPFLDPKKFILELIQINNDNDDNNSIHSKLMILQILC
ncbi:conserved oligomeric golgi complex component 3 [Anaeramoeba ignava]|uniref:Conserved oligomeric Golgi complex subunit 3 n=1 Tax=Anaeramoeba ignava TaxID=1746090 RepID=A0A9Q0RA62_ANAIG|nr:conserved oligomeric golgi complex component 3 [Anaeramoeba ignava]